MSQSDYLKLEVKVKLKKNKINRTFKEFTSVLHFFKYELMLRNENNYII